MIESVFSLPTRIYWEDTDAGGVVYHARYVAFLERARSEWLRTLGYGQDGLRREHGMVFVVRAMTLDFLRPARLDDEILVGAALRECRRASLVFAQDIRRGGDVLLRAQVRVAAVGAEDFRPQGIAAALYRQLKPLEQPEHA